MLMPVSSGSGPTEGGSCGDGPGVAEEPEASPPPGRSDERQPGTDAGWEGGNEAAPAAPQLRGASTFFSRSRKPSFRGTHSSEKEGRRSTPNLVHPGHTDALVSATPERAARIVMDTESEHIPAARPGQGINSLSRSIPNAGRPDPEGRLPSCRTLRKPVMPLVRGAEPGFDSPSGRWSRPPSGWSLHPIQDRFDPDRRKAGLRDAPGAPLRRGPGAFAPGPG